MFSRFLSAQLGNLAIVSEFLPRGSVYDLLRDKKTALSLKRRLLFATDCARGAQLRRLRDSHAVVCPGMVWLHGASPPILHLDLKTANLLVNEAWSVKVGDFGLARHKRVALAGRVGSPLYMAPEVLQGEAYDESADVYSFGVILCELHTRADPYGTRGWSLLRLTCGRWRVCRLLGSGQRGGESQATTE